MSGIEVVSAAEVVVLGCGKMGSAIARTLAGAGHSVVVWNRTRAKAEALALESDLIVAADTVAEAAGAAPVVITMVLSYDDAVDVIAQFGDVRPEVVLNFTTGFNEDAARALAFCAARGLSYLDGVLACYPQYVGRPETAVFVSGDHSLWQHVANLVLDLGGASRYVGADIGAANILDTGVVGAYSLAATGAFLEALAFLLDEGVAPEDIRAAMAAVGPIMSDSFDDALHAAVAKSYPAEKVTLDVLTFGVRGHLGAIVESGHGAGALEAALRNCERAAEAGQGEMAFYSVVEQLRTNKAPPTPRR